MNRELSCEQYQAWVMDTMGRVSEQGADEALRRHACACAECGALLPALQMASDAVCALPPLDPPAHLRERTRHAVLDLMAEERRTASHARWWEVGQAPLAVASAILVVVATLGLLGGLVWGSALPQGHLFFCAAMYTGLLVAAFSWIYGTSTVDGVHLDAAARIGVLALAITVAATTACPELHVLVWWDRSAAGRMFTDLLGSGGSSVVFGFGYGLAPGFLAALFGGRMLPTRPVANGLVAAGVVMLLATPVVYLQSAPFTSGVLLSWLAGATAGTICGIFGAFHVRRRVALASITD